MEVIVRPNLETASRLVADLLLQSLAESPHPVLGLATGGTMEAVYRILADRCAAGEADFSHAVTFNLDEYIGLSGDSPDSYRAYMNRHLFDHINIEKSSTHLPNGAADDIDAECEAYEARIQEVGGIDFQLLGIGTVGHIGFNEPLSALRSRTRAKSLTPQTVEQNARYFGDDVRRVPKRAITMGVGTILESRRCVLLATGKTKADIIAQAVEGPVTSMISASALQLHPKCTVVVDEDAASSLAQRDYYDWIFQNEPEWEAFRG